MNAIDTLIQQTLEETKAERKMISEWGQAVRQRTELLDALETIALGNSDPDDMVEIAKAAIAKATK
jgi:hypothetical protein